MKRTFLLQFSLLPLLLTSWNSWGAACCGGSIAAPALIAGDEKAEAKVSYSYAHWDNDVYTNGLWTDRKDNRFSETYTVEGAHIFADRWQAGMLVPIIKNSLGDTSIAGLGDVAGTIGYEYLPDWDYNPWRPKGLGYLQLIAPSGRPIQKSTATYQLDSRGRGFWAFGAGTLLTKIIGHWDVFANLNVHRSFPRTVDENSINGTLKPGWGGDFGLGGGHSWGEWRAGAGVTWMYEDAVNIEGATPSRGSAQRLATAALTASYSWSDDWTASVSYLDQTLFGAPVNTTLTRGATLQVQRRWSR